MSDSLSSADPVTKEIHADQYLRALRAAFYTAEFTGKKLVREFRNDAAKALLQAGLSLIPSDHLEDHQFVVSRGVYDAARKLVN